MDGKYIHGIVVTWILSEVGSVYTVRVVNYQKWFPSTPTHNYGECIIPYHIIPHTMICRVLLCTVNHNIYSSCLYKHFVNVKK